MKNATDTVSILIGRIGKDNLSKQASKKLKSLNEAHEGLIHLEKALAEADDKDKTKYQREVDKKQSIIADFEADFLAFLQDEEDDLIKRNAEFEEKEKARLEQEEADRLQRTEAKRLADEEKERLRLEKEEADRLAEEERLRLEQEEADRLEKEKNNNPNPDDKDKKSGNALGAVLGGLAVVAGIFFGINYFKNK